ncbi:hypothetical protein Tco_1537438, partial [Tanacetum coccineum]
MEAHCIALELKYQNYALKSGQHGQILNETSNKAKIKKEIEPFETINIELEHSVAKLLTENEHLNKENETLKKHYKDLYDSINITRSKTIEQTTSLLLIIAANNADLKATLQVVYDVLKLTPFYNAFQVTADAPEIYMQEFWASAYVHNRSVRFKMNNKKHIIGLEQFRDILQICPRVGNKKFVDPPLEKEMLIFLASLGHSGDIRKLTDVNVNKLHQPWRSFAAVINKCLCGTPSYDSLRLSQAQILWGMYNKKNVDYAYLLWEDFIFKIENKS